MKRILATLAIIVAPGAALACGPVTSGDISVQHAWSRATIGAERPAVFYAEVINKGSSDDNLIGISTPAAAMPMLHETVIKDGRASMPHAMSIPVPAGGKVELAPGGYHGMLTDLTQALKQGDSFPVTLTFEKAGDITVQVTTLSPGAKVSECADDT